MKSFIFDSTIGQSLEHIAKAIQGSFAFKTSAEVVMKARNLRFEAIRAIAREQGVEINDVESSCIDEKLLSLLADAHVRQLKCYFNNTLRHVKELSGAEFDTFLEFCETFKKHQVKENVKLTWDDIDSDSLREQFLEKVHSLTPRPDYDSIFGVIPNFNIAPARNYSFSTNCLSSENLHKDYVIERVLRCRWKYYPQPTIVESVVDQRPRLRAFTLCSRYHIFTNDDSHSFRAMRINNFFISRALRETA